MLSKLFKKHIIVSFKDEPKKDIKITLNDADGEYRFDINGNEITAIDYNDRSLMYRFDDFVLAQVAKSKKYVAYRIVMGDLKLITKREELISLV